MSDPTEPVRRNLATSINSNPNTRQELEAIYSKVWSTDEVRQSFEVLSFLAPFCVVREKSSGKKGTLMFQHDPRYYFNFQED
jgi:hypothetical protein